MAAHEFLQSQVHLDRLQMILIERSINEGKLDEAMTLIEAGIISGEKRQLRGLTNQYQALRVNLLQSKGDKAQLIDAARVLWLDRGSESEFDLLRKMIPESEWASFVEGLIMDIQSPEQLAWLYARENRWRDLMTLAQSRQQSSWLLEAYREQLESHFPEEVTLFYEKIIDKLLVVSANRSGYKQVVAYLSQMKKLGQAARADALIQRLCIQYANRPALLDELRQL